VGSEAPVVVRLPFILLFAVSTWLMYRLGTTVAGQRAGLWAAVAFNLSPVFSVTTGSWVLPDGPLDCALLGAALCLIHALPNEELANGPRARLWWLGAGLCAGFALFSKYSAVLTIGGAGLYLLTQPAHRRWLSRPEPYLAGLLAAMVFAPVIVWNARHDATGLFFQTNRLTTAPHLSLSRVIGAVFEQSLYLTPWLFLPLAAAWIGALAKGARAPRQWVLALLASGPIIVFTSSNLIARGLPHWPMPGWLFALPLLGEQAAKFVRTRPKVLHRACAAAAGVLLALTVLVAGEAQSGWLANRFTSKDMHRDPTLDLLTWTELKSAISERHLIDEHTPAIAALNWIEAGKLNYSVGEGIPVLCLCAEPQQFRYLHDPEQFAGRDILMIASPKYFANSQESVLGDFDRLETLPSVTLHRAGHPAIELIVIRGVNFNPRHLYAQSESWRPLKEFGRR
jgi:4-amino-4-deoxy-L-arabinose transferase-like glycosyltransferase